MLEPALGVALITQGRSYFLDFWPSAGCITLPILPVQAVSAVKVHDGGVVTLDAASYAVDALTRSMLYQSQRLGHALALADC